MTRTRNLVAALALALAIPAVIAGCGDDGGSDADPQEVLSATFSNDESASSGVIDLSIEASAEGVQSGAFTASISGPFQGNPDDPATFPQLDLAGSFGVEAAGTSFDFDGGVVVTEDNAFVEYAGQAYEVGTATFAAFADSFAAQQEDAGAEATSGLGFTELCAQSLEQQDQDASVCEEIDPESWFSNLTNEGTEDVEGDAAVKVSGDVDLGAMLGDLAEIGLAAEPDATAVSPEELESQIGQLEEAVTAASFSVLSGEDDEILRGFDLELAIDPSAIPEAASTGLASANLKLSFRLGAVGEEQTIEAPENPLPIDDLVSGLEGLSIPGLDSGSIPGLDSGTGAGG